MSAEFAGRLMTFVNDEPHIEEPVVLALTDFNKAGQIELMFRDRNEECYLTFRLSDLMRALAEENGNGE